ncbi:CBS domain-containing protein [Bacillaceae bacterium W0354]
MRNSEKFLSTFNKIEKFLNDELKVGDKYTSFSSSVKKASSRNIVVRRYKDNLLEFAELRNAIVHERTEPEYPIAEPHDSIVELIELVYQELTEPKKVIPLYEREVTAFQATDSLADLLKIVKQSAYSYFPVYEGGQFLGLVTENGITNWLAGTVEEKVSRKKTPLKEILKYEEGVENYTFMSANATIYEAQQIFQENIAKNVRFDTILITKNGERHEKLIGIITTWDIIELP